MKSITELMRFLLSVLSIFFFLTIPLVSKATHIVGGEMYYKYLGNNNYEITLVVYRDCYKGIPGFDSPGYISVFDTAWNRIEDLTVFPPTPEPIPLENYDSCTWVDTLCYEFASYQITVNLPPIPGGYILAYDRCCWNHSVLNLVNPDGTGITVVTAIPDSTIGYGNSSPRFINRTPTFFCVNKPFSFDHSAVDPDGDSLVYELFTPYNSSRSIQNSHKAPLPGPYSPLIYTLGYSLSNVLGSTIPLTIDPQTGMLFTHMDNKVGQFVFGVRVKEYRNGILIGQTDRTYQINSQNCYRYTVANFVKPISQCGDSLVIFKNKSDSAMAYLWHFGDGSPDSISSTTDPTHLFGKTGQYTVTLVAYSYQGNSCNDTITGKIYLYPELHGDFTWEEDECSNFVQFDDITNSPSGQVVEWKWDFGDGTGANVKSPYHGYDLTENPKTYPITLFIKNINGCRDTLWDTYTGVKRSYDINGVSATKYSVYPRDDSTLLMVDADSAVQYVWSPPEGLSSPNSPSTYASPTVRTIYKVRVKDNRGCWDEKLIDIDVFKYGCGETVVYIPNAFSPNGDGENDFLRVRGEEITYLKLSIFNRWGQLVYESQDPEMTGDISLGWDGRFNGVLQDPGVYVYQLEVECSDKRVFHKQGNITLIR